MQRNYQKELEEALHNPSVDETTGMYHIDNLYFASARTCDLFQKSFEQLLREVDDQTASHFSERALNIARAPRHNTVVALNHHDKRHERMQGTNESAF